VVVPIAPASAAAVAAVAPWTASYAARAGEAAAYVCRDFVCARPVTAPEALAVSLDAIVHPGPADGEGTVQ